MTTSQAPFRLPPVIAANIQPDPLESLRSPQLHKAHLVGDRRVDRDSVAVSEFNDIALDDDSFSPIALLSAQPSAIPDTPESSLPQIARKPSPKPGAQDRDEDGEKPNSISSSTTLAVPSLSSRPLVPQLMDPPKSHRKTASTTTIHSEKKVSLLINRLDLQDSNSKNNRGSVDGHLKLQEEFQRLHEKETLKETAPVEGAIDWNFWGAVISDYNGFASENPEELATAIQKGIPATLRGMMWQHMAASKDPDLETAYLRLLKETSTHEKAITRDLGRTFPHHDFFTDGQGIGQENLFNVLKAYSLYDPIVGYCQGLPFVVAILLLNMPDEEAFSLLVRLMTVYDLQGHFLPEMPKLQMRLFQFDRLVEELLPVLHVHFLRQGVKSSMFCSQWFLTLFSYRFPLEIVFRIYDNILANGIEAIFMFSIMLLKKNEDALLALKFDEILGFLNNKLFDCYLIGPEDSTAEDGSKYRVNEFVHDSVSLRITGFMLDSYRHEYEDLMRETNKHATLIDELRNSNRALSNQVKLLEDNLAQVNAEHVEVLNELVKQRLKNEEMEEELVRYKLLYAEAMHRNEQGANGASNRMSLASMMSSLRRGSSTSGSG